ncbi:hypothetical protein J7T55_000928 [Diaporthe amygdali]|uniref:uncharacterized protein n=1 Tax=Phomopsis amygdali TaxID=1214568 RepID=UPI0022FE1441|nr:uncharacterized protein J7T55_000928 [Diaporthe amygdali]KAJ0120075.1 hypothetical protein J7T55_000928 [Diaporthe amygdali]
MIASFLASRLCPCNLLSSGLEALGITHFWTLRQLDLCCSSGSISKSAFVISSSSTTTTITVLLFISIVIITTAAAADLCIIEPATHGLQESSSA